MKEDLRYPNYFKAFKCIGGECTDTCCVKWDIEIDKNTFESYKSVDKENKIKKELEKNVKRNLDGTDENIDYGKISLDKNKRCPFLNTDNYCKIYSELGETYLSNVCTTFPRVLNKINNRYEISLDLACPVAARLILNKQELDIEEEKKELGKTIIWNEIDTTDEFNWLPVKYFEKIREKSFKIIKNRSLRIDERMTLLEDFIIKIEEEYELGNENLDSYIEEYNIENFDLSDFDLKKWSERFLEEIIKLIDIENNTADEWIKRNIGYIDNIDKELEEKDEIMLENYLVNYMYGSLFPFSEIESISDGYLMLLIRYIIVKNYMKIDKEDKDTIKFIQKFSKIIGHHKNYSSEVLNYIKDNRNDHLK